MDELEVPNTNANTKRQPTEGENKDRQTGMNTETVFEQPGIRLGKLKL